MPARRKRTPKTIKKATFEKQLKLVVREAKKLDADIRTLQEQYRIGNYRML
jgi:hypothetical protein